MATPFLYCPLASLLPLGSCPFLSICHYNLCIFTISGPGAARLLGYGTDKFLDLLSCLLPCPLKTKANKIIDHPDLFSINTLSKQACMEIEKDKASFLKNEWIFFFVCIKTTKAVAAKLFKRHNCCKCENWHTLIWPFEAWLPHSSLPVPHLWQVDDDSVCTSLYPLAFLLHSKQGPAW